MNNSSPSIRPTALLLPDLIPPSGLFWHQPSGRWCSKIGYHRSQKTRTRIRSFQYFSFPHNRSGLIKAERAFIAKKHAWNQIVTEAKADGISPLWPEKSAHKDSTATKIDLSIAEVKEKYIADHKSRVSLTGKLKVNGNTHNTVHDLLEISMKRYAAEKIRAFNPDLPEDEIQQLIDRCPIDPNKPLNQTTRDDLKGFVSYWWSSHFNLSPRTRSNYCLAFFDLLEWATKNLGFVMPENAEELFKFGNVNPIRITKYDPTVFKALKAHAKPKTWLYCLLGLTSMYQGDISELRDGEIVRMIDGEIVPLTRDQIKGFDGSHDLYVYRLRNRTEHHYVEQAENPHKALHWLFPEAAMLLSQFIAPPNPEDRILLNEDGEPLVQKIIGKKPKDAIRKALKRVIMKAEKNSGQKINLSFKQFRKIGVTAVGRIGDDTTVRLYRSQPPIGDAKYYQLDDYEKKLTPVLKKWRAELIADGVL